MAAERPTFHESWYRVAGLRPRLRPSVDSARQHYRGKRWHVLRDAANNKFFRLDEASYFFVGLLDGRRTVGEAWAYVCERLGDAAPTQGEAIQLLGQLYTSNLLDSAPGSAGPEDAEVLLRRRNKRVNREVRHTLTHLLFAKIPLFDPDPLLGRIVPLVGWVFSPLGVLLWALLLFHAWDAVAGRLGELWAQSAGVLSTDNLFLLYASSVVTKLAHELGHGVACKRYGLRELHGRGGEVHTLGVMLLVFIPMPYVDATSAWGLRSKWQRAMVGAAGMYLELALAAGAALLWARTPAGTPLHALAFNAMFTAGVSTVLFNANPLVRFDGYYILSDLFELPNLAQRSREKLIYLAKRFLYGVKKPLNPSSRPVESTSLVGYGSSSAVYRVLLSASIVLFVADQLFIVGAILAIGAAMNLFVVPLAKLTHYLAASPELLKTRRRAALATAVPAAALVVLVSGVPVPEHGRADGVVEPERYAQVHAEVDGFVAHLLPSGSYVSADVVATPLLVADNRELEAQLERTLAQLRVLEVKHRVALASEPAEAQALRVQLDAVRDEIDEARRNLENLTVRAPFEGVWLCGDADRVRGRYVERGEALGVVAVPDRVALRVTADQFLGPRLAGALRPGDIVSLRVKGRPDLAAEASVSRVLRGGRRELPSEALGIAGGGDLPVAAEAKTGKEAAEPFFEVRMDLAGDAAHAMLRPGQRVVARFELGATPLLTQAWRWTRQLLQERFQI